MFWVETGVAVLAYRKPNTIKQAESRGMCVHSRQASSPTACLSNSGTYSGTEEHMAPMYSVTSSLGTGASTKIELPPPALPSFSSFYSSMVGEGALRT